MAKLRKMLGDVNSAECIGMKELIETQSKLTLAKWAVGYAKENYLSVFNSQIEGRSELAEAISACEDLFEGKVKQAEIKPILKNAVQLARDLNDNPIAQAAARAISTACGVFQTPTNALGFLFYGSATVAYSEKGLEKNAEVYDEAAKNEFKRAFESLSAVAVSNEENPAKISWGC